MAFLTLQELAAEAQRKLDRNTWDYLIGGSDTESALKRNRYGLDSWAFKPRILNDVSQVRTETELFGSKLRIPVLLAPIGSIQAFNPEGAAGVAKAAQEFGVLQILSSVCLPNFEDLAAQVRGPRIYQLYLMGDHAWMDDIIARAVEAGYTGFCLTADTQVYSRRERDILKRHVPSSGRQVGVSEFSHQATMTWDTVAHIKDKFDIPLIIKGVAVAEDAARCVELGVDCVYVSNHGGRQLDHTRACIDALPEVAAAVDGAVPVLVDGGFMRGADVVKALCLGAAAVGLGRLEVLALAADGAAGVLRMLELLENEIQITLALLGVRDIKDLNPGLLERVTPMVEPHALSAFPHLTEGY